MYYLDRFYNIVKNDSNVILDLVDNNILGIFDIELSILELLLLGIPVENIGVKLKLDNTVLSKLDESIAYKINNKYKVFFTKRKIKPYNSYDLLVISKSYHIGVLNKQISKFLRIYSDFDLFTDYDRSILMYRFVNNLSLSEYISKFNLTELKHTKAETNLIFLVYLYANNELRTTLKVVFKHLDFDDMAKIKSILKNYIYRYLKTNYNSISLKNCNIQIKESLTNPVFIKTLLDENENKIRYTVIEEIDNSEYYKVLKLRYTKYGVLSYKTIAKELNCTRQNIYENIKRRLKSKNNNSIKTPSSKNSIKSCSRTKRFRRKQHKNNNYSDKTYNYVGTLLRKSYNLEYFIDKHKREYGISYINYPAFTPYECDIIDTYLSNKNSKYMFNKNAINDCIDSILVKLRTYHGYGTERSFHLIQYRDVFNYIYTDKLHGIVPLSLFKNAVRRILYEYKKVDFTRTELNIIKDYFIGDRTTYKYISIKSYKQIIYKLYLNSWGSDRELIFNLFGKTLEDTYIIKNNMRYF